MRAAVAAAAMLMGENCGLRSSFSGATTTRSNLPARCATGPHICGEIACAKQGRPPVA